MKKKESWLLGGIKKTDKPPVKTDQGEKREGIKYQNQELKR